MTEHLDPDLINLRTHLRGEAGRVAHSKEVLADVRSTTRPIATVANQSTDGRDTGRPRWLAMAACVVLLGAGLIGIERLVQRRHDPAPGPEPQVSATVAATMPTTAVTTAVSIPNPEKGSLLGAQFFGPTNGWVLNRDESTNTVTLWTTEDGFAWGDQILPANDIDSVTMADTTNGWALASDKWWSTHDGGTTWSILEIFDFPPTDVKVVGSYAYALFSAQPSSNSLPQFELRRSSVHNDDFVGTGLTFSKGAGGNEIDVSIASQGDRTFVSFLDRVSLVGRLVGDSAEPNWTSPGVGRGGTIHFSAALDGGPLYVYSETGIWGGDSVVQLVAEASNDGGDTFVPITMPADAVATGGRSLVQLTAVDARTVVAQVYLNNALVLYNSHDAGVTWDVLSPTPAGVGRVDIAPGIMWATVSTETVHKLWVSTDNSLSWHTVIG